MNDIIKVDNLLPQGYANAIEADLLNPRFQWNYVDDVTSVYYGNNSGLAHVAFDLEGQNSDWYPFIKPLVYSIEEAHKHKIEKLFRIRVGFLPQTDQPEYQYNTPHVDFLWPHYTACYYANDSDGDTMLFSEMLKDIGPNVNDETLQAYADSTKFNLVDSSSPKKNSLCIFDGLRFHASTKPRHHKRRFVITVNYI